MIWTKTDEAIASSASVVATAMQIAAFYAQHPMFYDKTHPDYKNKKKRDFLTK